MSIKSIKSTEDAPWPEASLRPTGMAAAQQRAGCERFQVLLGKRSSERALARRASASPAPHRQLHAGPQGRSARDGACPVPELPSQRWLTRARWIGERGFYTPKKPNAQNRGWCLHKAVSDTNWAESPSRTSVVCSNVLGALQRDRLRVPPEWSLLPRGSDICTPHVLNMFTEVCFTTVLHS